MKKSKKTQAQLEKEFAQFQAWMKEVEEKRRQQAQPEVRA